MTIRKIKSAARKLGWSLSISEDTYEFNKFSPAGQDFCVEATGKNAEEIINEIGERVNNFDVSYETYIWLDDSGHGAKGAPYDMRDLYDDMEACLEMLAELYDEIRD